MGYQAITVTEAAGIATITLNRPEVMNALNRAMRLELTAVLQQTQARAVVITGAGRGFCAGQDLADAGTAGLDAEAVLNGEYVPMLRAIRDCPAPVIAAVNGAAVGAGANLALLCDVVIAAESAAFAQPFLRIGLIPDAGGTWTLPRQIGSARAMGAMLFGEAISARQAVEWGMIWEAVPDAGFAERWQARAAAVAAAPQTAARSLKRALAVSASQDLDAQLALEARLQGECARHADFVEGVAAFREKRRPRFA